MTDNKTLLRDTCLPALARKSKYFSIRAVRECLRAHGQSVQPDTLKRYLYGLRRAGVLFDAGKGWYSTLPEALALPTYTTEQALNSTYQAALTLSAIDLTKKIDADNASNLLAGVKNILPLLVQSKFGLPEAKAAAGKAALLSRIILRNRRDLDLRTLRFAPANVAHLKTATIPRPLEYLTKLRGTNDEAFHYWQTIHTLFGA